MQLEDLVGQRLVIGIPGTRITPEIVQHFKDLHAGGIIFYRINFESPNQLKKMISDLESALERKLLVTADHEGGRVIMFRDGITVFPDNLALGETGNVDYAKKQGEIESKELRRLGIDVNLSPVLDVLTGDYSPNIGIRSYGIDSKLVSDMGTARIAAMQKGGVSACAKHFPGKGHAPVDAHLGLPVIGSTWKEMEEVHLKPFTAAIAAGIDSVMSSHPYYPNLDPEPDMIATFSRKIIFETLRRKYGFTGVIFSDDLEMGAIKAICPIEAAGVRATRAGHDILLVCHDLEAQKKVYDALLKAYQDKSLSIAELEQSVARIEALKSKRKERFEGGPPKAEPAGKKLAEKICLESAQFLKDGGHAFDAKSLKKKKLAVIFPKFSFFAEKIMIEEEVVKETQFLNKELKPFGLKPKIQIVSIEPQDSEIEEAARLAKDSDAVVLFVFDAHLYPSNKKLLDAVQSSGRQVAVALLRDPYDSEFIQNGASCVTGFGWRVCQIKAVIQKIFGGK